MFNPTKIALAGIAAWLFFWLVTPVYPVSVLTPTAILYVAACYSGFFGGVYAQSALSGQREDIIPATEWQKPFRPRLFWTTLSLGFLGMGMRYYDRVVLRGADYAANALDFRESLTEVTAGPLSIAAAALLPFCFVPVFVLLTTRFHRDHVILYLISAFAFLLPTLESLSQLSRSVALTSLVMAFSAVVCLRLRGDFLNRKLLLAAVVSLIAVSMASTLVFSSRLGLMDLRLADSVAISVYADNLQPNPEALRGLLAGSEFEAAYYSIILPNGMYFLSGLYEFSNLWSRLDDQVFAYGAHNGVAYARALQLLFTPNSPPLFDEAQLVGKVGVFQTFFGGAWIDFGYLGPVFLALIGYVSAFLGLEVKKGNFAAVPIYLYLVVVILLMPVMNLINGGLGNYVLATFGILSVVLWDSGPGKAAQGYSGRMASNPAGRS